ncbi:MAG: NAD(P)/FAD-dependent oxidoreductase, partial [Candidatus Aenigmatarchaeota archaeon]
MEGSIVPYDCIIVGAGPAGITAGIYLIRKNLDILILTLDIGGQARLSTDVENYTGFTMIPGDELVRRFEEHLNAFNVNVLNERVKSIKKENDLFKVETQERIYWAKSVIIASGKKPRSLNVPGEEKLVGKGIFYTTLFNAPYFKDLPVAVVGGGNSAMQAILELSKFTKKIYVINIADDLTGDEILKEKIKKMSYIKI